MLHVFWVCALCFFNEMLPKSPSIRFGSSVSHQYRSFKLYRSLEIMALQGFCAWSQYLHTVYSFHHKKKKGNLQLRHDLDQILSNVRQVVTLYGKLQCCALTSSQPLILLGTSWNWYKGGRWGIAQKKKDVCSSVIPSETADTACQYSSAHLPQIIPFN